MVRQAHHAVTLSLSKGQRVKGSMVRQAHHAVTLSLSKGQESWFDKLTMTHFMMSS